MLNVPLCILFYYLGIVRLRLNKFTSQSPYFEADVTPMPDRAVDKNDQELQDQIVALRSTSKEFVSLLQTLKLPAPVLTQLQKFLESVGVIPGQVVDLLMSTIESTYDEKITILEATDLKERIVKAIELLTRQIHVSFPGQKKTYLPLMIQNMLTILHCCTFYQVLKISQKVHDNVEGKLNKKQREFYLRQQMAAIKEELGEKDSSEEDEMTTIENRLTVANLPPEVQKAADREIKRLKKMQPASSEYSVIRNYLDWLGDLPWSKSSEDILDVERARKQLNDDHHGLEKVKRRILEYLAVTKLQQLKGDVKGPILCLVGPPGVSLFSLTFFSPFFLVAMCFLFSLTNAVYAHRLEKHHWAVLLPQRWVANSIASLWVVSGTSLRSVGTAVPMLVHFLVLLFTVLRSARSITQCSFLVSLSPRLRWCLCHKDSSNFFFFLVLCVWMVSCRRD